MRIISIQVKGFGVLQERTLDTDSPLALFYGANEAGKSTLMGFVRAVLFGFPTRQSRADRYEPPMGGAHGGALTLQGEQGHLIRVERYDGSTGGRRSSAGIVTVTLGDGTTGGEELLHKLLGGLSADLFRSLFAFGLSELQELRTLQSDEISGYLYSAGLGVSGSTIMEAQRKLAAQADSLYKPRGRNQEINLLLKELEELDGQIRRSKERIGEYDRLLEERRSTEQLIAEQELRKQSLRNELDELTVGSKARSSWIRLKQISEDLKELPEMEAFPENATARLEALENELALCKEEETRLYLKQQGYRSELQALVIIDELLVYKSELNTLLEEAPLYHESDRSITELEAELSNLMLEVARLLKQLDEQWETGTLAAFPVSISLRERIRSYRDQFAELQERMRRLYGEQASLGLQIDRVQESVAGQERELQHSNSTLFNALAGSRSEIEEDPARALNRIARDFAQWRLLRTEREHLLERIADRERYREELLESSARAGRQAAQRQRMLAFFTLGAVILLSAALGWNGQGLLAGMVLAIGAGIFIYLYLSNPHRAHDNSQRKSQDYSDKSSTSENDKILALEQKLKAYENNLQQQAGIWLGVQEAAATKENGTFRSAFQTSSPAAAPSSPNDHWSLVLQWLETSLEDLRQEAEQHRHQSGELERKQDKLRDSRTQLQTLKKQDDQHAAEMHEQAGQLDRLQTEWNEWTQSLGFTGQLSPDALFESLQLVERGHDLLRRQVQLEAKITAHRQFMHRFELDIATYLGTDTKEPVLAIKRWKEQEQEQLRLLSEQENLHHQLAQIEHEQQLMVGRNQRVSSKLVDLLKEASADHGEQLRQNQSKAERRLKLLEEQRHLSAAMEALAGSTFLPKLKALLEEKGDEELERLKAEITIQIEVLEDKTNECREQSGRLASEIEKLELGTEHTDKLQKLEEYRASIQQLVDQYAAVSFASLLLKKARDIYERDRQPGVLIRASAYFEQMTQGNYTGIKAPFGEQKLVAMHHSGRTLDTGYLSRGTAEQLYLSMRFALAEEYAGRAVLPLIMDDILVNFDEQRMESCLQVINELSQRHQILLFTCHTHVRDAAKRMISDHRLIVL
ncbi:AAA family ATPase [Paenibacillus sp. GP183]|uniref:AAA family ATPase n=1 Tax=Paenibacillus sp. GP183 TaxID=1882751 RepID=UPI000895CB24|nr:AAA family ATPase [Paenibacillus sp. GP183]SEB75206.1 Uncharacterized protein YhaN [Paenibacillus sp. GP183]